MTTRSRPDTRRRTPALLLAAAITVLASTGCGADDAASPSQATSTAPNGEVVDAADVAFATDMIPHHAQALVLVDTTLGRTLDPAIQRVMDGIRGGQTPEIETMSGWLTSWGEPVPETARDHANAHGDGDGGAMSDMPGMVSDPDLTRLEQAEGPAYEKLLLELMIGHHEGAIEMSRSEIADGTFQPAQDLSQQIIAAQEREITTMKKLLARTA